MLNNWSARLKPRIPPISGKSLLRSAHTLKSSSTNIGALDFAARCREIETATRAGQPEQVDEQIQTLRPEFNRVEAALRAMLGGITHE